MEADEDPCSAFPVAVDHDGLPVPCLEQRLERQHALDSITRTRPCRSRQAKAVTAEPPEVIVADAPAWRAWLDEHHDAATGVWLVLAKKGTTEPTSVTYGEALEEALCHGWIDGQVRRRDETTYRQRFTPRRPRSSWSKRNVGLAERLLSEGRMHPAGIAEIERAKADGRWETAYSGARSVEVPADLAAALAAEATAEAMFEILTSRVRYAVLHPIATAKRIATWARRIPQLVAMLADRPTPHPQKRTVA